jgi:hypothetical protein
MNTVYIDLTNASLFLFDGLCYTIDGHAWFFGYPSRSYECLGEF